ncbi:MAG: putative molybdenum carrier protein, partial [Acidobacteriota bacterium]
MRPTGPPPIPGLATVISGGQTGVDRAALRAARRQGLEIGGWCPPGRVSEDGMIPVSLSLRETPRDRSQWAPDVPRSLRTEWNVRDAGVVLRQLGRGQDQRRPGVTYVPLRAQGAR